MEMVIQNFRNGRDTRRMRQTSALGSLLNLIDAHVNTGAEIEKRKAFVLQGQLPAGCYGLQATPTAHYTFGSAAAAGGPLPTGVTYQRLRHYLWQVPGLVLTAIAEPTLTGVVHSCCLAGKPFVVATFSGSGDDWAVPASTQAFFDGKPVLQMSSGKAWFSALGNAHLAAQLAQAINDDPPSGFTAQAIGGAVKVVGTTALDFTTVVEDTAGGKLSTYVSQPRKAATSEVRSTMSFYLTGGNSGGISLVRVPSNTDWTTLFDLLNGATVAWDTSLLKTAQNVATTINAYAGNQGYTAAAAQVGSIAQVTITSPAGSGAAINTKNGSVTSSTTLKVSITSSGVGTVGAVTPGFAGGVDPLAAVAQETIIDFGTPAWAVSTTFKVTLTVGEVDYIYGVGNFSGLTPSFVYSLARKVHYLSDSTFGFSGPADGAHWEDQDSGGFVEVADLDYSATDQLTAACSYQGRMALFSPLQIQIWSVGADPANYSQLQVLPNTGTNAALSVVPLGDLDVIYLAETGFRSLRVRDSSLNATMVDVGSAIDSVIQTALLTNLPTTACGVFEPSTGRYWCYFGGEIHVLSFYPTLEISAWSSYTPAYFAAGVKTTFTPVKFSVYQKRVYVLDDDGNVFLYGGADNNTYDSIQPVIEFPWLAHQDPKLYKNSESIDVSILGQWSIYASMNPKDEPLNYPTLPATLALTHGDRLSPNENIDSTFPNWNFPYIASGTHVKFVAVGAATDKLLKFGSLIWRYN